jgi:hypothetical protein
VPLAAALNGAKGETVVLNRRRGERCARAGAFTNGVDRQTLDAMQRPSLSRCRTSTATRAKAAVLGHRAMTAGRSAPLVRPVAPVGSAAAAAG